MQDDQAKATPDATDPSDEGGVIRWAAALAALGPIGKVDVTHAKVGNRVGFFVSVAEGDEENLEIDVKSPMFKGRVNVALVFFQGRREQCGPRAEYIAPDGADILRAEAGVSFGGYLQTLESLSKAAPVT